MLQIAVINEATSISDGEVKKMIPAFSSQWNNDLSPVWGVRDAAFSFNTKKNAPKTGSWWVVFFEDHDQAYALAYHVGSQLGSVEGAKLTPTDMFVAQMNALAKQLKMERTRFVNPHGIDWKVKPLPYSTAEDMARLTRYAMNKPSFRFYVSQKERQISFNRQGHPLHYVLRNTNELLGKNGIDGVKTGRSSRAGDCLILYANRESEVVRNGQMETVYPRHLMVVLLGSTNRFGEGAALIQRGWQLYDQWAAAGRMADPKKIL